MQEGIRKGCVLLSDHLYVKTQVKDAGNSRKSHTESQQRQTVPSSAGRKIDLATDMSVTVVMTSSHIASLGVSQIDA